MREREREREKEREREREREIFEDNSTLILILEGGGEWREGTNICKVMLRCGKCNFEAM